MALSSAQPDAHPETESEPEPVTARSWRCIVHDDPVNLMSYVTYVFQTYFGYGESRARELMLQVHNQGRATVSSGSREAMEADAHAMHSFGLWATIEEEEA